MMAVPSSPWTWMIRMGAARWTSSLASSFGSLMRLRTLFRCMAKVRMKLILASSVGWKVKPASLYQE